MNGFNQISIGGNLTAAPVVTKVGEVLKASFRIAANKKDVWTDKATNERKERDKTVYVDCEVWGGQAQIVQQYCTTGSAVVVHGILQTSEWDGPEVTETDGGETYKLKNRRTFVEVSEIILAGGNAQADPMLTAIRAIKAYSTKYPAEFTAMSAENILAKFESIQQEAATAAAAKREEAEQAKLASQM
jgi:single-stranded DNA-binding protein